MFKCLSECCDCCFDSQVIEPSPQQSKEPIKQTVDVNNNVVQPSDSNLSLDELINKYKALKSNREQNEFETISLKSNSSDYLNFEQPNLNQSYEEYENQTIEENPNYSQILEKTQNLTPCEEADILRPRIKVCDIIALKETQGIEGGYGQVQQGKLYMISSKKNTSNPNKYKYRIDKKYVCIKRQKRDDLMDIYIGLNEIKIHKACRHENLVEFIGVVFLKITKFYIITEYCDGMDLYEFIHEDNRQCAKTNVTELAFIIDGLTKGLNCLHENSILHRDLKPSNILLFKNKIHMDPIQNGYVQQWIPKITDFGLSYSEKHGYSQVNKEDWFVHDRCGNFEYSAPEVQERTGIMRKLIFSPETDIYSLGVVMAELISGDTPYRMFRQEIDRLGQNGNLIFNSLAIRKDCPKTLMILMWQCTNIVPKKRPAMTEILDRLVLIKKICLDAHDPNVQTDYSKHLIQIRQ